jgi:hypothetical protein
MTRIKTRIPDRDQCADPQPSGGARRRAARSQGMRDRVELTPYAIKRAVTEP